MNTILINSSLAGLPLGIRSLRRVQQVTPSVGTFFCYNAIYWHYVHLPSWGLSQRQKQLSHCSLNREATKTPIVSSPRTFVADFPSPPTGRRAQVEPKDRSRGSSEKKEKTSNEKEKEKKEKNNKKKQGRRKKINNDSLTQAATASWIKSRRTMLLPPIGLVPHLKRQFNICAEWFWRTSWWR